MNERRIDAKLPGPVTVEAVLRNRPGTISVRVDPACEHATRPVRTTAGNGPSARAVADANLAWTEGERRLTVDVSAPGADPASDPAVIVDVTVPPGSTLDAHTDSADVETVGDIPLHDAAVVTESGAIDVDAEQVYAETVSGPVDIDSAVEAVVRSKGEN